MKKFLPLAFLIFLAAPVAAQNFEEDIIVKLDGMSCEACAQTLEEKFADLKAVQAVQADLKTETVTLDIADQHSLEDSDIMDIIDWAGFDLISVSRY